MAQLSAIVSVLGIASSLYGASQQKSQYDDQADAQAKAARAESDAAYESELLADQNARNIESETFRAAELEQNELDQTLGEERARRAASGLGVDENEDSASLTSQETARVGQESIAWLKQSGKNQADIARWEGDISRKSGVAGAKLTKSRAKGLKSRGNQALIGGIGRAIGGAGGAYTSGKKAGWWGS